MNRTNLKPQEIKNNLNLLFQSALKSALGSLFSDIEKKIFLRAEHTENPADKLALFNHLEMIKKKNKEFEEFFFKSIMEKPATEPEITWLEATGNRNLALQIEDVITHAKALYGVEHAQFESRINWLCSNFPDHFSKSFFTINFLVLKFLEASKILKNPLKDQVIRSLGNQLLFKLEPLYILMNESLIQFGVIAEIKSTKKTYALSHADLLIKELDKNEQLMSKELDESIIIPTTEIIEFISSCINTKRHVMLKKSNWTATEFVKQFNQHLIQSIRPEHSNRRISNTDLDILESIGSLLSAIINKSTISPVIRNKVIEMQSIFLMTAFSCPSFMNQPDHPARAALITISSIGTNTSTSLSVLNEVANKISFFIDNFSNGSDEDFRTLTNNLNQLEFKTALPKIINTSPAKTRDTKEFTQRYSNFVREIIEKHISGGILSAPAKEFIENTLIDFLTYILTRHGQLSPAWRDANSLISQIVLFEADLTGRSVDSKLHIEPIINLISTLENQNQHWHFAENSYTAAYITYLNKFTFDGIKLNSIQSSLEFNQSIPPPDNSGLSVSPPPNQVLSPVKPEPYAPIKNNTEFDLLSSLDTGLRSPDNKSNRFEKISVPYNHTAVSLFSTKHIFNNEWFKVFIAPDLPLRTLKPSKIDKSLMATVFVNKNGVSTLNLSLDQFFQDIFSHRTYPVFESSSYAHDLNNLIIELKNLGFTL